MTQKFMPCSTSGYGNLRYLSRPFQENTSDRKAPINDDEESAYLPEPSHTGQSQLALPTLDSSLTVLK